jgi:hypothetical protein
MLDAVRRLVRLGAVIAALVAFVATVERREKPMRGTGRWSRRLAGLALLLVLPARVAAQTAITDANFKTAADAWVSNPTTAAASYGNIADWNTAAVTSMANLFNAKPTFNADISKWNVASVSSIYGVCPLCRAHRTPRLVWRSLIGGHFSTALLGLGACSCRTRTRAWLPCLPTRCAAAAPACHFHGYTFPLLGLGWGRLLPCCTLFWEDTHSTYSVVRNSTDDLSVFAVALHLDRRGPTHFAARARPVDPACTALTVGPSGLMRRGAL